MQEPAGVRVLVITPSFPVPETGAEQGDRAAGIRQLRRLGCEVSVIAKIMPHADEVLAQEAAAAWGVSLTLIPYTNLSGLRKLLGMLRNPLYFDGAAYEYADPVLRQAITDEVKRFNPQIAWFDYTYLWPTYSFFKRKGIPIVTRSHNFEPEHFLEEEGKSLINLLKFIPKFFGELRTIRSSTTLLAITPQERDVYDRLGARKASVLPLRTLPSYLAMPVREAADRSILHVFFMGSSYNVPHNRAAAQLVIEHIAPAAHLAYPGQFVFHIFGAKLPKELVARCDGQSVIYEGYVDNTTLNEKLQAMDLALMPSLLGAGMQQKIFEPLARGIPTIASPRAIAGYGFRSGEEYVAADTKEEYLQALGAMRELAFRQKLSRAARVRSEELFSQAALDAVIRETLHTI
ncbi:MAG: glycosyltransferase [Bacillota bacterium]